jgi:hypothetical protein
LPTEQIASSDASGDERDRRYYAQDFVFLDVSVCYRAMDVGGNALIKKVSQDIGKDRLLTNTETTLLSNGGVFAFIYLLSGMWSLRLVTLFVVAGLLSIIMARALKSLLGCEGDKVSSQVFATGGEVGMKLPPRRCGDVGGVIGRLCDRRRDRPFSLSLGIGCAGSCERQVYFAVFYCQFLFLNHHRHRRDHLRELG